MVVVSGWFMGVGILVVVVALFRFMQLGDGPSLATGFFGSALICAGVILSLNPPTGEPIPPGSRTDTEIIKREPLVGVERVYYADGSMCIVNPTGGVYSCHWMSP